MYSAQERTFGEPKNLAKVKTTSSSVDGTYVIYSDNELLA